jgi:ParB-like chromosome segregation protein Spo0J
LAGEPQVVSTFPFDTSDDASFVQLIPVSNLLAADSPRLGGIDDAHVARLAQCGADLPPIVVHRQTMRVVDGAHRLRAAECNKRQLIEVIFFDGSDDEAFIYAVELNIKHGLPLCLRDRKAAARRILATSVELSDRTIASKTGLSDKTVAAIRAHSGAKNVHLNSRRGRDGRVYPVDGREGRQRAARLIAERPNASLREIASAAGVSPATVSDVRKRILAGEEATGTGQRQNHAAARDARAEADAPNPASSGISTRRQEGKKLQPVDSRAALEQLRSDPSIRGREAGRELLRWLARYAIDVVDVPNCAGAIPPHRVPLVAALARQAASAWTEFAHSIDYIFLTKDLLLMQDIDHEPAPSRPRGPRGEHCGHSAGT